MKTCDTCTHCWIDNSVGYRGCYREDDLTETEAETYYAEMKEGCPYYKTQEEMDYEYLCALDTAISHGFKPFG